MVNTLLGIFFLKETYAPVILQARRSECEKQGGRCRLNDDLEDDRRLTERLFEAMQRPLKILFLQPIVFTMVQHLISWACCTFTDNRQALYQAITFGTNYSLYTNFEDIYGGIYGFSTTQIGLSAILV